MLAAIRRASSSVSTLAMWHRWDSPVNRHMRAIGLAPSSTMSMRARVQYIQRINRRVSRNVPRHLREFVAQRQAQLKFQIIAHSKFQIIAHSVVVLLQAACLALPRVLAARHNFACVSRLGAYFRTLSAVASSVSSSRTI